ncbi:hypothetical protein BCR33DRAFT_717101 [Rhizoclosmatium globosum]|uniref:Uncharacterized protein n=1 Tax=Rhizoclosmatium globosum TaxID=329046 RepID=A0A1Y2CAR4_9FUNG|nr:hypothetical protein BCR33DRAFT_717101 [Rhizoclosmatium globosum]|eukprot:ORY43977.1 hypothetical protein BCR33DRAFT_717101 [Rhizoclosmatium globosum]
MTSSPLSTLYYDPKGHGIAHVIAAHRSGLLGPLQDPSPTTTTTTTTPSPALSTVPTLQIDAETTLSQPLSILQWIVQNALTNDVGPAMQFHELVKGVVEGAEIDVWVLGYFTVADAYLFNVLWVLQNHGLVLAEFGNLQAYFDRINSLDYVQEALRIIKNQDI